MEQVLLQFFEGIRSPALTVVFGIFSALGEGLIVAGAVILVYWLAGQAGEQILFTLLSSAAANSLVKCVVQRPRPYAAGATEQLPSFFGKEYGDALSFPSGHTQASASALLAGAMRVRRAWMWILSLLLIALIACSRLYFGVHWPTDLLGGFLFGLAFALFWQLIFGHAYRLRFHFLAGMAVVAVSVMLFFPEEDFVETAALLAGGAVFLPLCSLLRCPLPARFARRLWRIPIGLLCTGTVFALCMLLPAGPACSFLKRFLLIGAATFLANLLFKLFKI